MSKYGLGGVGASKAKAVVGLSARMVSVNTGEILAVANGMGESTRTGTSLIGSGGGAGSAAAGMVDMTSSNFANTVLGEAVNNATQKACDGTRWQCVAASDHDCKPERLGCRCIR